MSNPYDPYGHDPYAQHAQPPAVQQHHYYSPAPAIIPTNGMATTAMVLGIIGFFCGLTAPFAIIFGHVAQSQIKRTGEQGSGQAIAGLILGYIVTLLMVGVILMYVILGIAFWGAATSYEPSTGTY